MAYKTKESRKNKKKKLPDISPQSCQQEGGKMSLFPTKPRKQSANYQDWMPKE
jgi:hypothetical protein